MTSNPSAGVLYLLFVALRLVKQKAPAILLFACGFVGCRAGGVTNHGPEPVASAAPPGFVVIPNLTNAVQFRIYTNASPNSPRLFNTFDIEAYGEMLLESPGGDRLKRWIATPQPDPSLHNILIQGKGPELVSANCMKLIEQASGPEWRYLALDAGAAYRDRLERYRRAVLFVEPDLFILYDHIVAKEPVNLQMLLHPPAAARIDDIWHDLRLDLPGGGLRIQSPGEKHKLREWQRIDSPANAILPGTATMQLGPTNKVIHVDLITVFAVYRGGEKKEYAFKLLESNTAVGARIHRDGLPTLVAFKIDPAAGSASLTGFGFNGPVGVDVFRPKR